MTWSVSEAKAKLSEVLERARRSPQRIENRGEPVAFVVSAAEFERLQKASAAPKKTAMAELFDLAADIRAEGGFELELPPREIEPARPNPFAEDE